MCAERVLREQCLHLLLCCASALTFVSVNLGLACNCNLLVYCRIVCNAHALPLFSGDLLSVCSSCRPSSLQITQAAP